MVGIGVLGSWREDELYNRNSPENQGGKGQSRTDVAEGVGGKYREDGEGVRDGLLLKHTGCYRELRDFQVDVAVR